VSALHAEELGDPAAPLIALVHGTMDRASGLRRTARLLAADHRVLLYDRRGYARSRAVGPPFGIATQVADLVGLLAGRRAVVVGHSYGGVIALTAAARDPDLVRAIGAYESPMAWTPWWPADTAGALAVAAAADGGAEAAADRFLRRMLGDQLWERLPAATRAERLAEGPALVGEMEDLRRGAPFSFDEVDVPVVAARGERSSAHHRQSSQALADAVPDGELLELSGVRHDAHAADPHAFAAFARRVVARAEAAGR
jgi:pimeloyl-ACP methyl ester carboxylesterase